MYAKIELLTSFPEPLFVWTQYLSLKIWCSDWFTFVIFLEKEIFTVLRQLEFIVNINQQENACIL